MANQNLASAAVQRLEWKGEHLTRVMERAEKRGAAYVIAAAIRQAKRNHPGWKRRSGRAERSLKRHKLARENGTLVAEWGSLVFYVLFLELHHGSFLRHAADVWYPKLADKIREFFQEMA